MKTDIKFGFWNYVESDVFGKEAVQDWADLHCNLPMSFNYDHTCHNKQDMLDVLDACQEKGMKLIIRDTRTRFRTLERVGEAQFRKGVKQAYADFGKHPAAFGFFVGDEPRPDQNELYIKTVQIVMEHTPGLLPFGNLVPYWGGGSDYDMLVGAPEEEHTKLVEDYLRETKVPLLGYDQYSQCLNEAHNQQVGIDSYFLVLDKYCELAKKYDIPFYPTLLCCGHWGFRVPTEDDIRWQIYTALAHGARGILWFHLYQRGAGSSYVNLPVLGPDRVRTPMFDILSRQHYIFNCYYREIFEKIEMTNVYHVGHIYDPKKRFCADDVLLDVNGKFSYPTIITYYKEIDSDQRWMSVVNAHQRLSNRIKLTYRDGKVEQHWLAPGEMKLIKL